MREVSGGCLCGCVRFTAVDEPLRVGLCHCLDCRKHHGAVFFAAAVYSKDAVTLTGSTQAYEGRNFCPKCGSSVFAQTGDEIEVHLGALDEPNQFQPDYELWTERREAWLPSLPTRRQFSHNRTTKKRGEE